MAGSPTAVWPTASEAGDGVSPINKSAGRGGRLRLRDGEAEGASVSKVYAIISSSFAVCRLLARSKESLRTADPGLPLCSPSQARKLSSKKGLEESQQMTQSSLSESAYMLESTVRSIFFQSARRWINSYTLPRAKRRVGWSSVRVELSEMS